MLTDADFKGIQKLAGNLATREDIKEVRKEMAENAQLTRHEEWIKEIARKAGVSLKF